jgi:hypothetical protein
MTISTFTWPTREAYDLAMKERARTVFDKDIRQGTLVVEKMGIRRYGGANLYVCVYRVGDWMVRCFHSNPPQQPPHDIKERYRAIADFYRVHSAQVSALIPLEYIEKGIKVEYVEYRDNEHGKVVNTEVLPIVKMTFLKETPSLGDFIAEHQNRTAPTMKRLCAAWLTMIRELESVQMAHGDLDLTNVRVEQYGSVLRLRLIDYDNVWIPSLASHDQTEHGHKNFQHPAFFAPNQRPYNAAMDRFSSLSIYISCQALVTHPEFYELWGADENSQLLFSQGDYLQEMQTSENEPGASHITQLLATNIPPLNPYIEALRACLRNQYMPPGLDDIIRPKIVLKLTPEVFCWEDKKPNQASNIAEKLRHKEQILPESVPASQTSPVPDAGETHAYQVIGQRLDKPRRRRFPWRVLLWFSILLIVTALLVGLIVWFLHQPVSTPVYLEYPVRGFLI